MSPPPDATGPPGATQPDATTCPPDATRPSQKRYTSRVRDEQARRTRRAIVTAAHDLFVAQGYAATTIDGIAEAAQVSRRTVFDSVGGKAALLKLALDWAFVGDDEPVALAERPAVKAIVAETDPRQALMLWVRTANEIAARIASLGRVLTAAADVDPAAAELLATADHNRLVGATKFIEYLASLDGGLAAGMTEQGAAELCWALTDGHLYRQLVARHGWSTADFNRWLFSTLAAVLLPPERTATG
jgi:AcrR family transcriptional regulator